MSLLGISLPEHVVDKIAATYNGMTPMDRFLVETLDVQGTIAESDGGGDIVVQEAGSVCASCAATAAGNGSV